MMTIVVPLAFLMVHHKHVISMALAFFPFLSHHGRRRNQIEPFLCWICCFPFLTPGSEASSAEASSAKASSSQSPGGFSAEAFSSAEASSAEAFSESSAEAFSESSPQQVPGERHLQEIDHSSS